MDIVYKCDRCGKLVYEYNILYAPHGCPKCGGRKVYEIVPHLTLFGRFYCNIRNKLGLFISKES